MNRSAHRLATVDLSNVFDQARITVGQADNGGGMAGFKCTPGHLFEQPRAKRVKLAHVRHVNLQSLRPLQLW